MDLKIRLQRMLQILEGVEHENALADIERDILLNELRAAYTELKYSDERAKTKDERCETKTPIAPIAPVVEVEPAVEPESESDEENEPEVEVELLFDESDEATEPQEENVITEPVAEPEPIAKPEVEVEQQYVVKEDNRHSAIMSLYDEGSVTTIGEQFHEAPSVADSIACPKGVAESAPVASLRDAIGVADKYMLVRELFGDDSEAYEAAIDALEAQPSLDDCIIYISENYVWSPNSNATKLMMELLQRKYN